MKNLGFILIIAFLSTFISSNIYSQESSVSDETIFVFDNKETISEHFADKVNNKIIEFRIRGLSNKSEVLQLTQKISSYRGVVSFAIGEKSSDNEWTATIELYKYANYWMYYKYLFIKNGINKVIFDNEIIMSENLVEN